VVKRGSVIKLRRISVRNGLEKTGIRRRINNSFPPNIRGIAKAESFSSLLSNLLADIWKLNLLQHLPFRDEDLMDKVCFTLE
jgi:hypothetical protein